MSLQRRYDILTTIILMSMVFASSQSKIPRKNTTNTLEKKPLTRNTTLVHLPQPNATTTDRTILPSSTSTIQFNQTLTAKSKNTSPTTSAQTGEPSQTTQTTEGAKSSSTSSTVESNAQENTQDSSSSTILVVSLSLGFCLLAVGVAAAVFFVRWKRVKKMKQGFQEEMAVICLHDELASEALYCSWKPFMDGNENNKIKLVIETSTSDANTSRANT